MQLKRFKWWREAFQILTEEEYKSSKIYSIKEIYQMYAQKLAKQRGVDVNSFQKMICMKRLQVLVTIKTFVSMVALKSLMI